MATLKITVVVSVSNYELPNKRAHVKEKLL